MHLPKLKLLTVNSPKTLKSLPYDYITGILYLAPHTVGGTKNVCRHSSPMCRRFCLNFAGRGQMTTVQAARLRRKEYFEIDLQSFIKDIYSDIITLNKWATKHNLSTAIRLNGTSDIDWQLYGFDFDKFPFIQFYDYTKDPHRNSKHSNYHLTFSYSGDNASECLAALSTKNVAVPFLNPPHTFFGRSVLNGDKHDLRFLDPGPGYIIALKAKGKLRKHPDNLFLGDNFHVINSQLP